MHIRQFAFITLLAWLGLSGLQGAAHAQTAPTIVVNTVVGGSGRVNASTDQFIVEVLQGSTVVGTATTSGSGTSVTGGAISATSLAAGTAYKLNESASGTTTLARYNIGVSCSNSTSGGTNVTTITALNQTFTPAAGDVISCVVINTPAVITSITLSAKMSGTGRVNTTTDQFTVQLLNGTTVVNATTSSTTTGTGTQVTGGTTGLTVVSPGTTYSFKQLAIGTTNFSQYVSWLSCTNSLPGGTDVTGVTSLSQTITPAPGDAISCDLYNTLRVAPTISLSAGMSSTRFSDTDQFIVQLLQGSTVVNSTSSSLSTGSGSTVSGGTTGATTVVAGTNYTLSELPSGTTVLSQYTQSVSCTNSQPNGTVVSTVTSLQTIVPTWNDAIVCTVTNAKNAPPTISVSTAVGGAGRVNASTDQFTVQVLDIWGSVVNATGTSTTTGSGTTVSGGTSGLTNLTATVTYSVVELPSGATSLANYFVFVSCTNSTPGGSPVPGNVLIASARFTVRTNDVIACVVTNVPKVLPTISLSKSLSSARKNDTDQFTVEILNGATVVNDTATTTTTGTGRSVAWGATIATAVQPNTTYTLRERAAGTANLGDYGWYISCSNSFSTNGTVLPQGTSSTVTPGWNDVIQCAINNFVPSAPPPPYIYVAVSLGGGRVNDTDQFVLQILQGSTALVQSQPTTGTLDSLTSVTSINSSVTAGVAYSVNILPSGTSDLSKYNTAFQCVNSTTGGTSVAGIGGVLQPMTLVARDNVSCTLVLTAKFAPPTLKIAGAFSNSRSLATDQYTVQLTQGATVLRSATTSGTYNGTAVLLDTGVLSAGVSYGLNLVPSGTTNTVRYTTSYSCGNGWAAGTKLTDSALSAGQSFSLQAGDVITCTVFFTLKPQPTVAVATSLGGSKRLLDTDQFFTGLSPFGGAPVNGSMTSGVGGTVASGGFSSTLAAGTAYYLSEQAGGTTNLALYKVRVSCTNSLQGGTSVSGLIAVVQSFTLDAGDVVSCVVFLAPNSTPTISVSKGIAGSGRLSASTDQFTLQLLQSGVPIVFPTSTTTSGTGSTVINGTTGVVPVTAGLPYSVGELPSGTTNLARYTTTVSCSNSTPGGTNVSGITSTSQTFTPVANDAISCTIIDTPKAPPTIVVTQSMGGVSRAVATDQFTVQLRNSTTTIAGFTTGGTGSAVTGATTGVTSLTGDVAYTVNELPSGITNMVRYVTTFSCTNSLVGGTNVASLALGQAFTPLAGDVISCAVTNTALSAPTIRVSTTLAGAGRVADTDQFTVQLLSGTTVVNATTSSTTAGTGTAVTNGSTGTTTLTGATAYTVNQLPSGTANLARYTTALSCTNSFSGGTDVSGINAIGQSITLLAGDVVTCGLVNTPKPAPTLNANIALVGAGRQASTDQFTVQVLAGTTVFNATTASTTSGTGTTVTDGTSGITTLAGGTSYTLNQLASGSTDLRNYRTAVSCTNTLSGGTDVSGINGYAQSISPLAGDVINCTITNIPKAKPTINVSTVFAGVGRAVSTDQFTVQVLSGATVVNATATSTSSGTGTTVTNGTTGITTLVYNTAYTVRQVADGATVAGRYTTTMVCSNSTAGGTNVSGVTNFAQTFTPVVEDVINCTITNTPNVATIRVSTRLGAARTLSTDQFTVKVLQGSTVVNSTATSTTSGTGSTVTNGTTGLTTLTSGTAYTIDVADAGTSVPLQYTKRLACYNELTGGTNVSTLLAPGQSFTPTWGDSIICMATATNAPATYQFNVLLGGAGRTRSNDQFRLQFYLGSTLISGISTTGTGNTVLNGSIPAQSLVIGNSSYTLYLTPVNGAAFSDYGFAIACVNSQPTTAGGTDVSGVSVPVSPGSSLIKVLPALYAADAVTCNITLTPLPAPTMAVTTVWTGIGVRAKDTDQFTAQVLSGSTVVNATTTSTTTGTGSAIAGGTIGVTQLTAFASYSLKLIGSGGATTGRYTFNYSNCSNAFVGSSTSFPSGTGAFVLGLGDVMSCNVAVSLKASTISVKAVMGGAGRLASTDQFIVELRNAAGTVVNSPTTGTTSGTGTTVTNGSSGVQTVVNDTNYTITQAISGTTNAASYQSTLACTNTLVGGTDVSTLTSLGQVIMPLGGDVIACTITNTPKPAPTISISTVVAGAGRVVAADQFTVQVLSGATVVNATTTSTTSGAGAVVTGGTTGLTTLVSGTAYQVLEQASVPANLARYATTMACTNSSAGGTNVAGITATGQTITPAMGDVIACVVTNTPLATTVQVSVALGGTGRINSSTDQFTVQVLQGAAVVNATSTSTSSGAGLTVSGGTTGVTTLASGTAYTLAQLPSGATNLAQYVTAVSCTNSMVGGTDVSGLTSLGQSFTPLAGDVIACTVTNTPKPAPTISVSTVLSGAGRVVAADQFTVQVKSGSTVVNATTTSTTSGAGAVVTGGTTGLTTLVSGTAYQVLEQTSVPANLARYATTMACTNSSAGGTNVAGITTTGQTITPAFGDVIACVVTHTPLATTVQVSVALSGTGRINTSTDQFTVQVLQGAAVVNATTTSTSSGSGLTVSGGTTGVTPLASGTAYTLAQLPSGSTNLAQYVTAVSCTNSMVGGTDVSGLTSLAQSFTPLAGDVIACTITNTPGLARVTVKVVSSGSTGTFVFNGTARANGFSTNSSYSLTTSSPGVTVAGAAVGFAALNTATEVQEMVPTGWSLASASCVDANAAVTGNSAGALGALSGNVLQIPAAVVRAGADLQCTFTNAFAAYTLSGRVILDTGAGSGVAHDAVQNGTEGGHSGVALSLTNCSGVVYSTGSSAGDGSFVLALDAVPASPANPEVCVLEKVPNGFVGVSVNKGNTAGSYTASTSSLRFTMAAATAYTGIVFGNAPVSTLSGTGAQQVLAGQAATYSHTYIAGSAGNVAFATTDAGTPAGLSWRSVLYADSTCAGNLESASPLAATPMAVVANQHVCLLTRVFSTDAANSGALNVTTLTATEVWNTATLAGATLSSSLSNTDVTTVGASGLVLLKDVRKVAVCPASASASLGDPTAFVLRSFASPGDTLEYRVRYRNNSSSPSAGIKVYDTPPAYTTFLSALCLSTPSRGISGCAVTQQPVSGNAANGIQWTLSDAASAPTGLQPGDSGALSFCVQVQQ